VKAPYFSLHEVALLSLCGALIFVLKTALKIPLHMPGHSGIFWVIPLIIGTAIVRKPGAGTYIGMVSGLLASFFGLGALHVFDLVKYLAMGITVDIVALFFGYRLDNPGVGFIAGAAGNMVKMGANYSVHLLLGVPATFIVIGIGLSAVSHLVFGGLGGVIAALVNQRLLRAGVVGGDDGRTDD
jgi:ABC-type thiamin/hydroxymethylpyrimidine transport system permease subunit